MKDLTILHIRYLEPYGTQIYDLVMDVDCKKVFVNRSPEGIGSLAEAINRGIKEVDTEYCWIVTNNTFAPTAPYKLLDEIKKHEKMAAIHPCFDSDHSFLRPHVFKGIIEAFVPFVEFTSPIVRTQVLKETPLDEDMPYWGHDLDWGFRVREKGYSLAVHHGVEINHVYIRNQKEKHPITKMRWDLRKSHNMSTTGYLVLKYGKNWKRKLSYK